MPEPKGRKVEVTIPEGEYCNGCEFIIYADSLYADNECQRYKEILRVKNTIFKCPACLEDDRWGKEVNK